VGYSTAFLDGLRGRVVLAELVRRHGVKLVRRGREYAGLCPFHNEKTPSFDIVEDQRFFHCFGCGAHGDAIAFLMRADKVDFRAAVEQLAGGRAAAVATAPSPSDNGASLAPIARREKDERNRRIALRMWQDATPARGSPVEKYLRSRGLALPPAPVLRFAWRCWNREAGRELPAMLARVDDINGEFVGVHRTWLTPDGGKAALRGPKMSLGRIGGAAVRLAPVAAELAIAEGIESALTAIVADGMPTWSAVASGGMKNLVLPAEVRVVTIIADHDGNGVGQRAASNAAQRWLGEGRRVRVALPPRLGSDINDMLTEGGDREWHARTSRS
jgi:hypothetical protein